MKCDLYFFFVNLSIPGVIFRFNQLFLFQYKYIPGESPVNHRQGAQQTPGQQKHFSETGKMQNTCKQNIVLKTNQLYLYEIFVNQV